MKRLAVLLIAVVGASALFSTNANADGFCLNADERQVDVTLTTAQDVRIHRATIYPRGATPPEIINDYSEFKNVRLAPGEHVTGNGIFTDQGRVVVAVRYRPLAATGGPSTYKIKFPIDACP